MVQFQGNCLIVEEARSTRKPGLRFNPQSRPRVYNNSLEYENTCPKNNLVPGHITYAETAKSAKGSITGHTQNRIVIFGDRITRRIRVRDFNRELNTGHARIRTFPSAVSKEFPHYITPTLEDGNFDAVILHFGVNDLLRNRNQSEAVDELILNLEKTGKKCTSFGVRKVIVSSIVYNKRVPNSFVDEANSKIISMGKHKSFEYINNGNISSIHLFDDGLHLLESGMCILTNNFIGKLNYFFRTHLHHPNVHFKVTI